MNPITNNAEAGLFTKLSTTGRTPATYVPTTGRNCDTTPTHRAIAIGAGVPIAWNAIQWKKLESSASNAREYKYPPVLLTAISQPSNTLRCRSGDSREHKARRNFGPSATM